MRFGWATVVAILCMTSPSHAQTQAQQDRLDTLARYTVTAPFCEKLGMTIDEKAGDKFEAALKVETASWNVDPVIVQQLMRGAFQRQGRMFEIDLDAAAAKAKTDAELRRVREIFLSYGRTCLAAAADPIFSKFIAVPAGYDLERAATAASDALLEKGGLASWQTPAIQARGDMMMVAGACRAHVLRRGPGRGGLPQPAAALRGVPHRDQAAAAPLVAARGQRTGDGGAGRSPGGRPATCGAPRPRHGRSSPSPARRARGARASPRRRDARSPRPRRRRRRRRRRPSGARSSRSS